MTTSKVIAKLVALTPAVIEPRMRSHARCVAATRIGIDTLRVLGIEAHALAVNLRVLNKVAVEWHEEGGLGGQQELFRRGGWVLETRGMRDGRPFIGSTREFVGTPWDGHLVVHVPETRQILDLDLRASARPERGIILPPAMAFPWDTIGTIARNDAGVVLTYEPRRDPLTGQMDTSYLDAPDFRERLDDEMVADLVALIRKG